ASLEDDAQVAPPDVLEGDVVERVDHAEVEDLRDVGVVQLDGDLGLVDEHGDEVLVLRDAGEDALHRHHALEPLHPESLRPEDLGHAADVDALEERVFAERDWLLQRQSSWFEYSTSPCSLRTNRPGSSRFTRPVRPWRRRRSWMCCCFPRGSRRRSTIGAPSCFPAWASREATSLRCTRIRPTARARSSMRPSGTVFSIRRTATSSTFDPDLSHLVALADLVDDVEALRHLTEDGVLAVEVRLGRVADEEL